MYPAMPPRRRPRSNGRGGSTRSWSGMPPYTLPTAADGPTEYGRGLASALDRLALNLNSLMRPVEAIEARKASQAVLEQLASGPFASDTDRQRLGQSYSGSLGMYINLGQW